MGKCNAELELLLFFWSFHGHCVQIQNAMWQLPAPVLSSVMSPSTRDTVNYMLE